MEKTIHELSIIAAERYPDTGIYGQLEIRNAFIAGYSTCQLDQSVEVAKNTKIVPEIKVRTYRDVLNTIPDVEIREKAINNFIQHNKYEPNRIDKPCDYDKLSGVLSCTICWKDTPEGQDYWEKYVSKLEAKGL